MRQILRSLAKSPGFTIVAIAIVAIGIGATTSIFSALNALVLQPLALPEPGRLAVVYETNLSRGLPQFSVSIPNYADWKSRAHCWESLAAAQDRAMNLTGGREPELLQALQVTANFFPTLGVPLSVGRNFRDAEDRADANHVVIVSAAFWQRRFAGQVGALGQTLLLDNEPYTLVGVLPPGVPALPPDIDVFLPLAAQPAKEARMDHNINVLGRLKPGVSLEQADAEMKTLAAQIYAEWPNEDRGWSTTLMPLARDVVGDETRRGLYVLLGAVALLLLIACSNLSNLMMVRASGRAHELAVRTALGATRWQLARQLLTESLIVTGAGGAAGVLLAAWSIDALQSLPLPRATEIRVDVRVLVVACAATVFAGVFAALGPAWKATRTRPQAALKGRTPSASARSRLRDAMVVAQVALSLALLTGTALLARSFWRLWHVDPGFSSEGVLTLSLRPTENAAQFYDDVDREISALPGVTHIGTISALPLTSGSTQNNIFAVAPAAIPPEQTVQANWRLISGDYFGALQIPLLRGHDFRGLTAAEARSSVVISAALARIMWGESNPIGRQILRVGTKFTVIGVVGDVRSQQLGIAPMPTFYMSVRRFTAGPQSMVVRTNGTAATSIAALRATIHRLNPNVPIFRVRPMDELRGQSLQQERLLIVLLGGFAGVSLLLAALGTYGLLAFNVQQRTTEIGIRLAIGAQPRDVLQMVLRDGARLVAIGVGLGLLGSCIGSRMLTSLLFETPAVDLASYGGAIATLASAALLAALIPARRATRVDPLVALRAE